MIYHIYTLQPSECLSRIFIKKWKYLDSYLIVCKADSNYGDITLDKNDRYVTWKTYAVLL
jgi:hypothetical protein